MCIRDRSLNCADPGPASKSSPQPPPEVRFCGNSQIPGLLERATPNMWSCLNKQLRNPEVAWAAN
eukprot:12120861-Alexandrium_andersonii.AAC.1